MKLVDLIPLKEIDFSSQKAFDAYRKNHKLRPDTKVKIAGKTTTAGAASKVKGTSVFGGDKEKQKDDIQKQIVAASNKLKAFRKSYKDNYSKASKEKQKKMDADLKAAEKEFEKTVTPLETQAKKLEKKNEPKPKDLISSVENHLNKLSGGNGYAQKDDVSGAIVYNMGDGDMPTYTLYMGKEGGKHRISLEPTYGNDPKKLQGKIDKSFDKVQDAIKFMGDVAKKHRRELEMQDK